MIPVTKPFLPPREEYDQYLNGIWQRNWLTNNGPLVNQFEIELKRSLNLDHCIFVANGTLALQLAIRALDLKGEIITTPFSYIASSTSICWEGCTPVFVDIDPDSYNINPALIEEAITEHTKGILATHVYGNPCNHARLKEIADKNDLRLIYDGAHAFGVSVDNQSIFNWGDISITSFHATKIIHTVEGGGLFTRNPEILRRLSLLRNFGHTSQYTYDGIGINAKNSVFHAAMGLANLKYLDQIIGKRKSLWKFYKEKLETISVRFQDIDKDVNYNYSYFPIRFETESVLEKVVMDLEASQIFSRRYFYPSLSTLSHLNPGKLEYAEDVASTVLCLPLYHELNFSELEMIIRVIKRSVKYG